MFPPTSPPCSGLLPGRHSYSEQHVHPTHQSAVQARGLVADLQEFDLTLREAKNLATPRELRSLFVTLINAGAPAKTLWDLHQYDLMSDFLCQMSQSAALNRALTQIDLMLHKHGKNTESVGLARVDHPDNEYHRLLSAFDRTEMRAQADGLIPRLNLSLIHI